MDDVQEAMIRFRVALRAFDEALLVSHRDLQRCNEQIEGAWQDAAARTYHGVFDPLDDLMRTYLTTHAPRFEEFVDQKLVQLDQYLHGDG